MKGYLFISGIIFAIVALLHVLRLVNQWQVQFAGSEVPMWISWPGAIVPALLCVWAFALALRKSA